MPILPAIPWAVGWIGARTAISFTGKTLLKKPVLSLGGAIIGWELFDVGGTKVGGWVEGEFKEVADTLLELGVEVVETGIETTASVVIETVEKIGPAFFTGVENTLIALRESLRGREVKWITGFTMIALFVLSTRFLWNASKTAGMSVL